ncbi:glycosyl hydrolase family 28-related protein [Terriglobus aquaticus]|uniref:Glycosyl hydrolase family 28-related protein n=1 Tax=Terriglobus aquaticus TaxID=940139 RepID=A0ABW9KHI1_9BACT
MLRSQAALGSADQSLGIVNVRSARFGARADGKADDTAALNTALAEARRLRALVFVPAGDYRLTATLDVTGLEIVGAGRENTVLHLDGAVQQNAVVSRGNTMLRDIGIHGGWDGRTRGLKGSGFAMLSDPNAKPPYFGYDTRLDNVSIQYTKEDCIFIEQGGYESLHNVKCNASGQNSLVMESDKNPGMATTTVNVDGMSTFSDTYGYAVFIHDGQTISFSGRTTMENTDGIRLTGGDGRTLKLSGIHQENTRTGKFLTAADSGGIGLTLTDNFMAGTPVFPEPSGELTHWGNVTTDANALGGTYSTGMPTAVRTMNAPDGEPVEIVPGGWRVGPAGPTVIGLLDHPAGAAWSARLTGHWMAGDGTPKVAHEFLVSNLHPVVQVGATSFRLSLNASGRLQVNVTPPPGDTGPFEFLGTVELIVDRHHGANQDVAIETPSAARLGTVRVNSLAGKGTSEVCVSEDGTLYRCKK